ncbi:MAG TPA: glycerol-3-phosphate 1-O-acyltransferase PlsY [Dictyoglomaceae bacterium]|nr:glycerol-3-phosphate 1-O-acyltransferase PlsY [Dictyoglomaceae bacterium]HOL40005.1 glycerol-3-phosphate 1-O-acyltransferase PlsY [Dictyoglomaceae bacterium]HPP15590.1 glycerol-3-phosphate 1-O-acyltransferase PlsY [Dictyoglomaceae bacterium]
MKFFLILLSYLLGSIPSALIIGKIWENIDVRNYGSGNLGATNVFRVLGWIPAILVAVMDAGKGILAVHIAKTYMPNDYIFIILCIIAAVVGHSFPIFANFHGGRSVGISFGIFLYLFPKVSLLILIIGVLIAGITKYKSVASITCAILYPVFLYIFENPPQEFLIGVTLICLFIIYRHIPNIKRLLKGEEHKLNWKIKK